MAMKRDIASFLPQYNEQENEKTNLRPDFPGLQGGNAFSPWDFGPNNIFYNPFERYCPANRIIFKWRTDGEGI
ncbi:hypothetical protein [Paenibacillus illinoisensis]|uniref:hypothetical protein n=1 Tax=Paenibacillus illinoisensis TaxID=59845 RepID=UPI001C8D1AA3|nr:hypothetical protein [Paenibacillus illinoisensis]